MRYAQGVTRQQSTAPNRAENAAREGQKSRGSSAHAETPRASVRPRDDEPGEIGQRVQIALDYYGKHVAPDRDLKLDPWDDDERRLVEETLCAPRWSDRKGVPLVQLLRAFYWGGQSDHNRKDPSRQTLKYLCAVDDRIKSMAAVARNRAQDVAESIRKGLDDREKLGRKTVDSTERVTMISSEVAEALARGDFAAAHVDAGAGRSKRKYLHGHPEHREEDDPEAARI